MTTRIEKHLLALRPFGRVAAKRITRRAWRQLTPAERVTIAREMEADDRAEARVARALAAALRRALRGD